MVKSRLLELLELRREADLLPFILTHLNIVMYAFAFWLNTSVRPFLTQELGVDIATYGMLQSAFNLLQLIGGPLVGRVGDAHGARAALILTQGAAAGYYISLALSYDVTILFLAQVPGIFMHVMQVAQSFIAIFVQDEHRADGFSRLSISYSVGMLLGTSLSGRASEIFGYHGVAMVAGFGSLLITIAAAVIMPQGKVEKAGKSKKETQEDKGLHISEIISILKQPTIFHNTVFTILMGFAINIVQSQITLVLKDKFSLSPGDISLFFTLTLPFGMLGSTFIIPYLENNFSKRQILSSSCTVVLISLPLVTMSQDVYTFSVFAVLMSLGSLVLYTTVNALNSLVANPEDMSTSIALSHASRSACGVVGPTVGGLVIAQLGFENLGAVAALLAAAALFYMNSFLGNLLDRLPNPAKEATGEKAKKN
eukprot:Clim_evm15s234 gene=Clim_evmTU15s234